MSTETLLNQLEQWYKKGKHEEIVKALLALPVDERDYNLNSMLARAMNNLSHFEEALLLLETIREQGQDDPYWHFRMGYALYYIDGREAEAVPYLERAIELGDDYPTTYELLLNAKSYMPEEQSAETKEGETTDETDFTPKGYAVLSLNMRLQPKHRAKHFEDGLDFMLRSRGLGCVSGGGTMVSPEGEILSCDIEMDLTDDSEAMQQSLLSIAEKLEVAEGSKLKYRSAQKDPGNLEYDAEYPTGRLNGLAVYLNEIDLPDEVYDENNTSEVFENLLNLLNKNGALVYSYWEGDTETALYFYGEGGYDMMLAKISSYLKEHPLCQKCRVVQIA